MANGLALPETIEDILKTSRLAKAQLADMYQRWVTLTTLLERYSKYPLTREDLDMIFSRHIDEKTALHRIDKVIDQIFWRWVLNSTVFASFLSFETLDELRKSTDKGRYELEKVADFNMQNLEKVLQINPRDEFVKTVVSLFRRLSKAHKTNSGFSFGSKLIFNNMFDYNWCVSVGQRTSENLHELEKAVDIAERREPAKNSYLGKLHIAVSDARKAGLTTAETDSIKCRLFKNGNGHFWIKNQETIDILNRVIIKELGEKALGFTLHTK
jgi:hypothetical protein